MKDMQVRTIEIEAARITDNFKVEKDGRIRWRREGQQGTYTIDQFVRWLQRYYPQAIDRTVDCKPITYFQLNDRYSLEQEALNHLKEGSLSMRKETWMFPTRI